MSAHALIIGLEHYQSQTPLIPGVPFAEADATAFYKALVDLGLATSAAPVLLSPQATKTTIESRFKALIAGLRAEDSFIFFFAGHGLSINDQNFLTCHDTQRGDLPATSVSLAWIFEEVRKSKCKHVSFFLDCCHSGLPIDDSMRGIADHLSVAEFKTTFGNSEYHVAFAACKPEESSYSSIPLKHGIWTHHVLRALSGEEPDALEKGCLVTSHSLQNYLSASVPVTLRTTISAASARQTPCCFGNTTAEFVIADVQPLIDARRLALAKGPKAPNNAMFVGHDYGSIKSLSGFKKGSHRIPTSVDDRTRDFVVSISTEELKEHANKVHAALRHFLNYGVNDVTSSFDAGFASLNTKDFEINLTLSQCEDEHTGYAIRTEVTNFRDPAIIGTVEFNKCMSPFVELLQLRLPPKFDVKDLIARLEKGPLRSVLRLDYNFDITDAKISFTETGVTIRLRDGTIEVSTLKDSSPIELLESFLSGQAALLTKGSAKQPLLES